MNSTIHSDLLELKARFETWRTNRKYLREPIPDELWKIALGHHRCLGRSLGQTRASAKSESDWIHFVTPRRRRETIIRAQMLHVREVNLIVDLMI